jgi:hypothetical protein
VFAAIGAVPAANVNVADEKPEYETEAENVVVPQPNVYGVEVVVNPKWGNTMASSSPTVTAVLRLNVKASGVGVEVLVLKRLSFRLLNVGATMAVDDAIAVAAMSVDPAKVTVAVRDVTSAFTGELGVVAPEAIVSSQNVCFGNVAVAAVNVNVAAELRDPLATTVNEVEPHPLSTMFDVVLHTKSGINNEITSPAVRSAVNENENDTDVAVEVSGDANASLLALISGWLRAVDFMIAVAGMSELSVSCTATVRVARCAACVDELVAIPEATVNEHWVSFAM